MADSVRCGIDAAGLAARTEYAEVSRLRGLEPPSRRVLVVGGDGSVNAVASWLLESSAEREVGIVPAGTGNNLARGLGLPLEPSAALGVALNEARTVSLDVLRYEASGDGARRYLVQTGALGFPAAIAGRYDRLRRFRAFRWLALPFGTHIYRILALAGLGRQRWREWRGKRPLRIRAAFSASDGGSVPVAGETLEEDVLALFLGNERSLGGNFIPCPEASPCDGKMDLCLIRAGVRESYLRLFSLVARGRHTERVDSVLYRQGGPLLEISLSEPSPLLVDGDLWVSSDSYRFELLAGRLRVVAPD